MSDRLALANAIEEALTAATVQGAGTVTADASVVRAKAERMATVIFDAIHENVATKADVQGAETRLNAQIAAVRADLALAEHRLFTRLGGLAVVLAGLIVTAIHLWPPH